LHADAPRGRLDLDPQLPAWLPDLTLRGLRVGPCKLDLQFWRDGERTRWDAQLEEGQIELRESPWRPWLTGHGPADQGASPPVDGALSEVQPS
jgi:hypothetical protein